MNARFVTSVLVLFLSTTACMCESPPDQCAETVGCFDVDSLGCCEATTTRVSICNPCPMGMVVQTDCRDADCEDPCEGSATASLSAPAPQEAGRATAALAAPARPPCRVSTGDGCCGMYADYDSCGECVEGSVPAEMCTRTAAITGDAGPICMP